MAEMQKKATRESYGEALRDLAEKYPELVVLDADLAAATKTGIFKKAYPERFFDCGIAEANMMGVAAGNRVHVSTLHCNNVLQQRLGVVNIGAVIAGAEDGDLGNLPALNDHLHSNRAGKASSRSGIGAVLIGRLLRNRCHRRDFLFCRRCCRRVLLFRCVRFCRLLRRILLFLCCLHGKDRCSISMQRSSHASRQYRCRQKASCRQIAVPMFP